MPKVTVHQISNHWLTKADYLYLQTKINKSMLKNANSPPEGHHCLECTLMFIYSIHYLRTRSFYASYFNFMVIKDQNVIIMCCACVYSRNLSLIKFHLTLWLQEVKSAKALRKAAEKLLQRQHGNIHTVLSV